MKTPFYILLVAGMFSACTLQAQETNILRSLETDVPGQGKVRIHQDARITALVGTSAVADTLGVPRVLKARGYRVQVYAGNNTRQAKNEAYAVAAKIKEVFPDLPIYTSFLPPRWLCRVGDFSSIEEADAMMRRLLAAGDFKEVSIVRDQINIPL